MDKASKSLDAKKNPINYWHTKNAREQYNLWKSRLILFQTFKYWIKYGEKQCSYDFWFMYKKRNDQNSYIRVFFIRYWTRTFKGCLSVLPHKKRNSGIAYLAAKTSWKWLADESGEKKRKERSGRETLYPHFSSFLSYPFQCLPRRLYSMLRFCCQNDEPK